MAGELIRWQPSQSPAQRAPRWAKGEMANVRAQAAIAQVQEDETASLASHRLRNGVMLGFDAAAGLTALHRYIGLQAADDPGLEMTLRPIEQQVGFSAGQLIYRYMAR